MARPRIAKEKLLNAALSLIREQGYSATTVEDLCVRAGVTKGAFFHYFKSKEELGVAAVEHWASLTGMLFARAPYHDLNDPLDRVLAYIEFRRSLLRGDIPEFTCVAGTMVQEAYGLHQDIRRACAACIFGHAETLVEDIEAAMASRQVQTPWSAQSLAAHTQAVLQGAFILAKASGSVSVAIDSVEHLYRYVELLFHRKPKKQAKEVVHESRRSFRNAVRKPRARTKIL